jgi:hypothetical protein
MLDRQIQEHVPDLPGLLRFRLHHQWIKKRADIVLRLRPLGGSRADGGGGSWGGSGCDGGWQTGVCDSPLRRRSSGLGRDGTRGAHPRGTGTLLLLAVGLFRPLFEWALDALRRACLEATLDKHEFVLVTKHAADAPVAEEV